MVFEYCVVSSGTVIRVTVRAVLKNWGHREFKILFTPLSVRLMMCCYLGRYDDLRSTYLLFRLA
jgi:hypothetical protein